MLNIGEAARQGGVTVETLRYYERQGLIASPDRGRNGYRKYAPEVVRRIRFIKRAQDVGFTLRDVGELLSLRADAGASCGDVRHRALGKLSEIEEKIEVLSRMRDVLGTWTAACPSTGPVDACPILDALDGKDET
ncbi:MAG: heavy metal-responsive transcriptional regulator [Rhodospirillales bacterium]|nr:heavy metal-responsive transcriptional regulator [Rhodospirillales bacterium]MBO6785226.1 heavy metal-responsive transcriptional regulator [Rhodospirillales bacterium]